MTDRDQTRLAGVHPALMRVLDAVFDEMEAAGTPMFVIEGVRSDRRQQDLWRHGRDAMGHVIGRVVTYKDGIVHRSNHQPHADGLGYAVDCAFAGEAPFDPGHPWHLYGQLLEERGARWGGRFSFVDLVHAEWPEPSVMKKA